MLDVPDTVLSVAVFVEDVERDDADLVQLYERENGTAAATRVLLRDGERGRERASTCPWQSERSRRTSSARARSTGA